MKIKKGNSFTDIEDCVWTAITNSTKNIESLRKYDQNGIIDDIIKDYPESDFEYVAAENEDYGTTIFAIDDSLIF